MRLLKTGVNGLDDLLYGGVPEFNHILIAGGPGVGKTLLTFEILYHAAKNGIPAAFIALDEHPANTVKNAKATFSRFADVDGLIEDNMLVIDGEQVSSNISAKFDPDKYSFGNLISDLEEIIEKNNAKVVAIDSISFIKLMLGKSLAYRRSMVSIISNLRRLGVTAFLTTEMQTSDRNALKFKQEFFLFDGLIALYQLSEEHDRVAAMEIMKMRGNNHSKSLSPYTITENGFKFMKV